ncbi:MAG: 3'(2'),5'-bisphosphate nucleotidase CysQ [Mariniphaga sp.]|nr:3'(2'),5'-bisphosphate nucleotidase CysQ [Mariniphaga sp.]
MDIKEYIVIAIAINAGKTILGIYNSDVDLKLDQSPLTLADRKSHYIIKNKISQTKLPILSKEGRKVSYQHRRIWSKYWLVDPLDGTKEFIKKNGEFTVNIALIENSKPVMGVVYSPVLDILYVGAEELSAFRIKQASELLKYLTLINDWRNYAESLPLLSTINIFRIVVSRSHLTKETLEFINSIRDQHSEIELISKGSSLKLCLIAEGYADIYPRFAPTMEWDTATGHAIINATEGKVCQADENNKESLLNPKFIAGAFNVDEKRINNHGR